MARRAMKRFDTLLLALLGLFAAAPSARAAVSFYTDEAAWTVAVNAAAVASLDTTALNVGLADETIFDVTPNQNLGPKLTFRAENTGLCGSFVLEALEPGAGLIFDDGDGGPPLFPANTLSIGDINSYQDDDFRIAFPTASFYAAGLYLVDNTQDASESFQVFGRGGLLGTLGGLSIPDSSGNGSTFIGAVASEPIASLRFQEDTGSDEIAIRDFRFGCAAGDPDADGLSNLAEQAAGTDPNAADSDADGLLDGEEIGTGTFGAQRILTTLADDAHSVFAADLDGDGDVDVVSASLNDDEIAWHENANGAGKFGPRQLISTLADGALSAFAADVDGDGDLDVLSASSFDDEIAWYENLDGAGSFGAQQVISTLADGAEAVFAADIDGDGVVDALSASFNDDKIAWYQNQGGIGTFEPQQVISTLADGPRSVFAADIDGDGDADVLSASFNDGEIAWYENTDGAGSFAAQQVISTLAVGAISVVAADVDGDGDADVLSASALDSKIAWYENTDGAGTFAAQEVISTLANGSTSVFAADVDGDGDTDVLSASFNDDEIAWYENTDGAGTFAAQQVISTLANGAYSVFGTDVDGDGDLDVLSASSIDDKIAWYPQREISDPLDPDSDDDGLLDGAEVNTHGTDPLDADSDGDGLPDAYEVANGFDPLDASDAAADTDSDGLSNLAEQAAGTDPNVADSDFDGLPDGAEIGTGLFGAPRIITTLADGASSVFAADLDGDGDPDVLSASMNDDEIAWYPNVNGAGKFGAQQLISTLGDSANSVFAADLDGDGDLDAIASSSLDGEIAWYENADGTGSFGPQQVISTLADSPRSVFAADVDGDGDTDVLSASYSDDEIAWYENRDGFGSFGPQRVISNLADGASSVFAADMDGDGDLDALSASFIDDEIAWYENTNGSGTFGPPQLISAVANGASSVFAGDVDGDGDVDVLAALDHASAIAWYENTDGAGTFAPASSVFAHGVLDVFAADVDGDGDLDALSASGDDDEIAWYENTDGAGSFGPQQVISTTALNATSVFAADLDGDGDIDVLSSSSGDDKIAWYPQREISDPLDPDSDDDGLLDGAEVNTHGTDPLDADTDGDGMRDPFELANGFDPLDAGDAAADADSDGLSNLAEQAAGTDPNAADSDADGLLDGEEIGTGAFGAQRIISTLADRPLRIVAADVDGDGDIDALSSSLDDDEIAWYENANAVGRFGPQQLISTLSDGAWALFAADVDGDGDLDALSGSVLDNEIAWYENLDGAGSFGSQQVISTLANQPTSIFATDLDGDGDLDAISASYVDDEIAWYENLDGAGSFGTQQLISSLADGARSVFAVDVDGDGDADVLSASELDDEIAWYENLDGAGSFGSQQVISTLANAAWAVFAADVDGDGDVDVLSASASDSKIAWYENLDGAGSFGAQQVISTLASGATSVFATDVDGDGDTDVLSASFNDDEIAWYENLDGAGSFGAQQLISTLADGPQVVLADDVDGDGDLDVLSASSNDDTIAWYPQREVSDPLDPDSDGDGLLDGAEVNSFGTDPLDADTDGDGMSDLFETSSGFDPFDPADARADADSDGLSNLAEQAAGTNPIVADSDADGLFDGAEIGTGIFGARQLISTLADGARSVFAADLDGDGDPDVLSASEFDDEVAWYENLDGAGSFGPEQLIGNAVTEANSVSAADLDGDGDLDVLACSTDDGQILWFENLDGAGSFGPEQLISGVAPGAVSVFAADVDGDADLDVLSASSSDDKIAWYENLDAAGTFGPQQVISTQAGEARSVFAADVDGDGDPDVLSAASSALNGEVSWYENLNGAGSFGAQQAISTSGTGFRSVFAADVDGDGDADVLSASYALLPGGLIAWHENLDGAGSFGPQQVISLVTNAPRSVFAADVDGDGDPDVLSASSDDDTIAWYENLDGAGSFSVQQPISVLADGARAVFAYDIDGDGDVDALSASALDDAVAWYPQLEISDPLDPDTDDDTLLDGVETNTGFFVSPSDTGTDPQLADTDGDGFDDGDEVAAGSDPTDPLDFPPIASVPALGPVGTAVLALLLAAGGAIPLRRRLAGK
jgi:hypothetical protein